MLNDRFWTKVKKRGPDDCWEWTSNTNNKGYGLFKVSGPIGNKLAHRLSYEDAHGAIPIGGLILHSCDNPLCVNPRHLRVGDYRANSADMDARGRRHTKPMPGATNPQAKVGDLEVIAMRRAYLTGEDTAAIAARYGFSPNAIHDITGGRSWQRLLGIHGGPTLTQLLAEAGRRRKSAAVLTPTQVRAIRRRLADGQTGRSIAIAFGVHFATISDIKNRKIWRDI